MVKFWLLEKRTDAHTQTPMEMQEESRNHEKQIFESKDKLKMKELFPANG